MVLCGYSIEICEFYFTICFVKIFEKILGYRDPRYKHENSNEQVNVWWMSWKVTKSHEKL